MPTGGGKDQFVINFHALISEGTALVVFSSYNALSKNQVDHVRGVST